MSTASSNNDILSEAMQALDDNVFAPQTPANEDNAARDSQDLDPDECNYADLVQALKRRYDRPHRTRARFHMQMKQLPRSGLSGSELRETWFRISGILHGLRKFEDFKMVLPILDLVRGKFPQEIQTKLHDFEFQKEEDFDLDAVMRHLDNIIASKEKYEDSTMLIEDYAVNVNTPQRGRTRRPSPRRHDTNICHFCGSPEHETPQCYVKIPLFVRRYAVHGSRSPRVMGDAGPEAITLRYFRVLRDAATDFDQGENSSWRASGIASFEQFVRILQKNPAADIPLIKQLTDELSQLTAIYIAVSAVTPRKEVYLPEWSDAEKSRYPQCAVLIVAQNLKDVHDTLALATATVAEAQQVLSDLSQQHFERLLTIQDDEVFAATGQVQPQARSSGAGTMRQMQSPTFSEEIDKLARKASLRQTPQPIGDIPMDEPQQVAHVAQLGQGLVAYQKFPLAVAAEEDVIAQIAAPVVVPAQVAAQPMASMQTVTAPSAPIQPVKIPLERAVSSGIAELAQDPRSIYTETSRHHVISTLCSRSSRKNRSMWFLVPSSATVTITPQVAT
ncbi:unnamed protein product [Heligmosomoides polygyrus]|uniref:Integrase catalytic domain-containing protein n=1 Tax=Heligmosomoides polygyrus TaxID=6339 RepID=A0A183FTA6_HELPZ|nr:unnamed protein product [Heligmosomoides polygyrus]